MGRLLGVVGVAALLAWGCGGPSDRGHDASSMDASSMDGPGTCAADAECSDGLVCIGAERCAPGASNAASRGCA